MTAKHLSIGKMVNMKHDELRKAALEVSRKLAAGTGELSVEAAAEYGMELADIILELISRAANERIERRPQSEIDEQIDEDLRNRFGYHAATDQTVLDLHGTRMNCLELARWIVEHTPPGRERSLALTNLEEVMFWTNGAISRQSPLVPDPERVRK